MFMGRSLVEAGGAGACGHGISISPIFQYRAIFRLLFEQNFAINAPMVRHNALRALWWRHFQCRFVGLNAFSRRSAVPHTRAGGFSAFGASVDS